MSLGSLGEAGDDGDLARVYCTHNSFCLHPAAHMTLIGGVQQEAKHCTEKGASGWFQLRAK